MSAAQRKLDADLVKSLRHIARQLDRRSAKLGIVIRMAAERIEALSRDLDRTPAPGPQADNQPASTPIN
jgi:hypothetical protein